jgi:protocatechuate 3,4-dioxygenase beta subunit
MILENRFPALHLSKGHPMERRKFIGLGATAFATLALPKALAAQACPAVTEEDRYLEGPFHRAGAPRRIKLASEFEPGQRISIQGVVSNCKGPMAGVNLDVWNATDTGCYESFGGCPAIPGHPEAFRLRGQMTTGEDGKYAFETILPGAYLNGGVYRPRHIHIIIGLPYPITTPRNGATDRLVTQLYFEGDPYIKGDYAADHPSAANRIIPMSTAVPSLWQGVWNIGIPDDKDGNGLRSGFGLDQFDVLIHRRGSRVVFGLPSHPAPHPVEIRVYEATGALAFRSLQTGAPVEVDFGSLRSGSYIVELSWWTRNGLRKESVPMAI